MSNAVPRIRLVAPALLTASLLLGACSNGDARFGEEDASHLVYDNTVGLVEDAFLTGNWRQIRASSELRTQAVVQAHAVDFPLDGSSLSNNERNRMMAFLRSKGVNREDHIQLDGLRADSNEYLPITEARIEALRLELANLGLRAHAAQAPITVQQEGDNRVAIVVTRTLVALPDCRSEVPARGERPVSGRNCANQTNLGLMVANPADLQQGMPGGPADGTAAVLGIERYRKGEITPLAETLSTKELEQE